MSSMANRASAQTLAVEALDRLLVVFCPLGLLAVVVGEYLAPSASAGRWLSAVRLVALGVGLVVALGRRQVPAARRIAAYCGCFAVAAVAECLDAGLGGNGLMLALLAVLLAAATDRLPVRLGVYAFVAGGLGLAAMGHAAGRLTVRTPEPAATPTAWLAALAVFIFACVVVVYWRHLGVRLQQANDELRVTEGHFRATFDMAGDGILLIEDGRFIAANRQAQLMFGYGEEEFLALAPMAISPDCQSNGRSSLEEARRLTAAATESPQQFRWVHRRKDNREFEAEVSLSSAAYGTRRIHLAIVRDLTDYRIVERENRLLATALNHAGEAVAITDAAGRIVYVNRAFEEITGYSRHEVHGQNPRILKSGRHDALFYQEMWATINAGKAWRGRLQNRRKDGRVYTENSCITPLRDERGAVSHFVAVKRDISHELELEDQLVQSRKMEAVGRLAGGIAHDFNNILQVITGNVAMAAMDAPDGHPVQASLDEITRASERAVNLVQQLLAFSRREELRLRPVEIGALVGETARMLRRLIGEDISLELVPTVEALPVLGDPGRIEQVLLNLCVNARDAMPDGGRISVAAEMIELDAEYCRDHPEARPGRHVVVAVTDEGCGIPKEIQHRIFEPFFSTKEVGRGTGLGLATVYAIVRQHGGFINLYSELGLGTTFRFYLPASPEAACTVSAVAAPDLGLLQGRGETVLLAEDDEQVLAIAKRVLTQGGYRVLTARDGAEALALHAAYSGPINLAILDVVMPHCNGRQAHDELRRRDPSLPVLFATGYSYHHLQDGLIGQYQVLRKPFTPRELLGQVRSALAGRPAPESTAGPTLVG